MAKSIWKLTVWSISVFGYHPWYPFLDIFEEKEDRNFVVISKNGYHWAKNPLKKHNNIEKKSNIHLSINLKRIFCSFFWYNFLIFKYFLTNITIKKVKNLTQFSWNHRLGYPPPVKSDIQKRISTRLIAKTSPFHWYPQNSYPGR